MNFLAIIKNQPEKAFLLLALGASAIGIFLFLAEYKLSKGLSKTFLEMDRRIHQTKVPFFMLAILFLLSAGGYWLLACYQK